jgi:hypothetical protein
LRIFEIKGFDGRHCPMQVRKNQQPEQNFHEISAKLQKDEFRGIISRIFCEFFKIRRFVVQGLGQPAA